MDRERADGRSGGDGGEGDAEGAVYYRGAIKPIERAMKT
jgi:hypothetical protein